MDFPRYKLWLFMGALLGGLSVAMGAFGAHWLQGQLKDSGLSPLEITRKLDNWETGARYMMYHGLAVMIVGLLAARRCTLTLNLSATCMTLGTLLFSGCLFVLVLTGQNWLGKIVPIGGMLMIFGWMLLIKAAIGDSVPPAETPTGTVKAD